MKKVMSLVLAISIASTMAVPMHGRSIGKSLSTQGNMTSGDGYVTYDPDTHTWRMGTARVEKTVQLNAAGQFLLTSFRNKLSGREYIQGDAMKSGEFSINIDQEDHTGASAGWIYDSWGTALTKQNEIHLVITFHNRLVNVKRNYIIYPDTGVIQEWSVFENISRKTASYGSPGIFNQRIMQNDVNNIDFHYMTGGGNFTGSHVLKVVKLTSDYKRVFDSYDKPEAVAVDGIFKTDAANRKTGASVWHQFYGIYYHPEI